VFGLVAEMPTPEQRADTPVRPYPFRAPAGTNIGSERRYWEDAHRLTTADATVSVIRMDAIRTPGSTQPIEEAPVDSTWALGYWFSFSYYGSPAALAEQEVRTR
jgi:hypothetical protein